MEKQGLSLQHSCLIITSEWFLGGGAIEGGARHVSELSSLCEGARALLLEISGNNFQKVYLPCPHTHTHTHTPCTYSII